MENLVRRRRITSLPARRQGAVLSLADNKMMVVSAETATGANRPLRWPYLYLVQAVADLLYEWDVTADEPALASGHR
jgi:hypothetical protein